MRRILYLIFGLITHTAFAQTTTFSQDNIRYFLDNGIIKVGFDRRMGGMISYFEKKSNGQNLVNNHDAGRQAGFETRIYPDDPTGFKPYPNSLYLSDVYPGSGGATREWNGLPQGSFYNNYFSNTSNLGGEPESVQFNSTTGELYIKCKLWEWGFVNNNSGTYNKIDAGAYNEYWIKLDGVGCDIRLKQVRNIPYFVSATNNGMSANAFINVNYNFSDKWYTYNGNSPWTSQPVNLKTSFSPNEPNYGNFWDKSTEGWTALTNNNDFGMGIFSEDPRFTYLYGEKQSSSQCMPGQTTCSDEDRYGFGSVSLSTYSFPCGGPCTSANSTSELNFSLMAGTLTEIRAYAYQKKNLQCTPPTINSVSSSSPTCNGNTLHLNSTVSSATSYNWTGPNGFTSTQQSTSITNVTPSYQGVYTLTASNGTCTATATTNVVVNTITGSNASSNSPICSGNTLNLSANGGTNYSWTGPNGFTSNQQNPSINLAGTNRQGTYTVTVSSAGCGLIFTSTVNVVVNQNVSSAVSSNSPICVGGNLSLSASGGTNFSWTGPNGFTSSMQNPTINAATAEASGVYTVTLNNGNCTEIGMINVSVNQNPTASISYNSPLCLSNSLNLSGSGGTSYVWTGPNNFSSSSRNPTINNAQINNQGTYLLTVQSAGCTAAATTSVNLSFSPSPIPQISGVISICEGNTINLTSTNQNFVNTDVFSWQTPRGFSSSNQNISISNSTIQDGGIYTLTITNETGCSSVATTAVTVHGFPALNLNSNSPICSNKTLNLSANSGFSYLWTGPNNYSSTQQNPSITNAQPTASGNYFLTATNGGGCSSTAMISTFIQPSTNFTLTTNSPICQDNLLTISTGLSQSGNNFSWSGPNSFTSTAVNLSFSNASTTRTGIYTVTVTNVNGCTSTATINVLVKEKPILSFGNNSPVCQGNTLSITAINTVNAFGNSFAWKLPNGFTSSNQNLTFNTATLSDGGIYSLTLTNSSNCSVSATANVIVNPRPTPNLQSNSPVCIGSTLGISASGGTSYAWVGPNSFTSSSQNLNFANALNTQQGSYTVTVINQNACSATAQLTVFTKAKSGLTAESNAPICIGNILNLNASEIISFTNNSVQSASTYLWSGPNSFSSTLQNPVIANVSENSLGTYSVTLTNINGCTTTATVSVSKYEILTQPTDNLICNNTASFTTLTNIPSPSYQWQIKIPGSSSFTNITDIVSFSGINSATLSLSSASTNYSGSAFRCVISGTQCAIITNEAFLTRTSGTNTTIDAITTTGTVLETHQKITSSSKISGNANVTYRAEKSVLLTAGFVVEAGAKFVAKIEGCQ